MRAKSAWMLEDAPPDQYKESKMHAQADSGQQPFNFAKAAGAAVHQKRIHFHDARLSREDQGPMLRQEDVSVLEQVDWALQPFRLQRQREQECLLRLAVS